MPWILAATALLCGCDATEAPTTSPEISDSQTTAPLDEEADIAERIAVLEGLMEAYRDCPAVRNVDAVKMGAVAVEVAHSVMDNGFTEKEAEALQMVNEMISSFEMLSENCG